jgi:hypothetical protein
VTPFGDAVCPWNSEYMRENMNSESELIGKPSKVEVQREGSGGNCASKSSRNRWWSVDRQLTQSWVFDQNRQMACLVKLCRVTAGVEKTTDGCRYWEKGSRKQPMESFNW